MKYFIVLLVVFTGCGVTNSTRKLNYQNYDAAIKINSKTTDPEIKQASKDIAENSAEISEVIGLPDRLEPYSPETSHAAREESRQERNILDSIVGFVSDNAGATGGAGGLLFGAAMWLLKRRSKQRLVSTYQGVENILPLVQDKSKAFDILRQTHSAYNVYADIKQELKTLKDKGIVSSR